MIRFEALRWLRISSNVSRLLRKGLGGVSNVERFTEFIQLRDDGLGNTEGRVDNDLAGPGNNFTLVLLEDRSPGFLNTWITLW